VARSSKRSALPPARVGLLIMMGGIAVTVALGALLS